MRDGHHPSMAPPRPEGWQHHDSVWAGSHQGWLAEVPVCAQVHTHGPLGPIVQLLVPESVDLLLTELQRVLGAVGCTYYALARVMRRTGMTVRQLRTLYRVRPSALVPLFHPGDGRDVDQ